MITPSWAWAGAKATGTSHIRANKGCDDNGGCFILRGNTGETILMVVSDGAGSAEHSSIGSRVVRQRFLRCASKYLIAGGALEALQEPIIADWLDDIRDHISVKAKELSAAPRDFAATLVASFITHERAVFIHIGDGAGVYRLSDSDEWRVGTWPASGEYASTTYFVTDDPQPRVTISHINGSVREAAIFTDGIERLVLDFSNETVFAPFFNSVFSRFNRETGRDRVLSKNLRTMLDSSAVCEKTDDDKTLILARRN